MAFGLCGCTNKRECSGRGILTYIAEKFGVDFEKCGVNLVEGGKLIDLDTCVVMKFIKVEGLEI